MQMMPTCENVFFLLLLLYIILLISLLLLLYVVVSSFYIFGENKIIHVNVTMLIKLLSSKLVSIHFQL